MGVIIRESGMEFGEYDEIRFSELKQVSSIQRAFVKME